MKKFLFAAAAILAVLFVIDKTFLKEEGLVNRAAHAQQYKKIKNAEALPVGLEAENRAPDFTLTDLAGKEVKLSDYKGKKILLNFWATWCPPCKAEMPHMEEMYKKYQKDGLEILAVNVTATEKKREDVGEFISAYKLTFPIPMDERGGLAAEYEVMAYPTSYFIDSDGVIRSKAVGGMTEEFMEKEIRKLP